MIHDTYIIVGSIAAEANIWRFPEGRNIIECRVDEFFQFIAYAPLASSDIGFPSLWKTETPFY